jgi:hypothetical protein
MTRVGLGLRALKGGAVVVAVAVEGGEPQVVRSTFLATGAEGDRLSLEPYGVAAEIKRDPQGNVSVAARDAVAEGRKRQDQLAAAGLDAIVRKLEETRHAPAVAALLLNRAGWVTDVLEYSIAWPEHVPVAEGLAVRDALRFACTECGITVAEVDEKSLPDLAANALDLPSAALDARLKALGTTAGKPWRNEQKLACLAAWFAIAAHRS